MLLQPTDGPVLAETATVISVDQEGFAVGIETTSRRVFDNVPWLSPYVRVDGYGQFLMPEIGARCVVIYTPNEDIPFIMGWYVPPDSNGKYAHGRVPLAPGDQVLRTPDGAYITLRTGGLIEVQAADYCRWLYIPFGNVTRGITENFELFTAAGTLIYNMNRATGTTNARMQYREEVLKDPTVQIEAGHIADGSSYRILYLDKEKGGKAQLRFGTITEGEDEDPTGTVFDINVNDYVSLSFGKDIDTETLFRLLADDGRGNALLTMGKHKDDGHIYQLAVTGERGDVETQVGDLDGGALVKHEVSTPKGKVKVEIGDLVDGLVAINVNDKARIMIDENGRTILDSKDIRLGGKDADDQVVTVKQLAQWTDTHTHPFPTGVSGVPIQRLPQSRVSSPHVKATRR